MSGTGKAVSAAGAKERPSLGVTHEELLGFLDGLDARTEMQPGEITTEEFADRRGIRPDAARKLLATQVRAGRMTKRPARKNGKPCFAYSLVKK